MKPAALQQNQFPIESSELIVNPDGSIYHLRLRPEHIADNIIVVGDQNRVEQISKHFSKTECKISNREFVTHTGEYNGVRISAISTGIGTDNIDIVMNELDAAVNIDLSTRLIKKEKKSLNIVRLGTSGSLQEDIPVDATVISTHAVGFDGVMPFYNFENTEEETALMKAFMQQTQWSHKLNPPYFATGSTSLINKLKEGMYPGITATANGFYGPQGRVLRLSTAFPQMNEKLNQFSFNGHRITNYEMETSALYALGNLLGHQTCTVCAIIANRYKKEYSRDYHATIDQLIVTVLNRLTA